MQKEEKDYKIYSDLKIKEIYFKLKKCLMMNKLMNGLQEQKKNMNNLMSWIKNVIKKKNKYINILKKIKMILILIID